MTVNLLRRVRKLIAQGLPHDVVISKTGVNLEQIYAITTHCNNLAEDVAVARLTAVVPGLKAQDIKAVMKDWS